MSGKIIFLDYDGTLTPIVKHPKLATLSSTRREILQQLAKTPGVKLAIVSGRKLSDVKKMIGIPGIIYVGNHGFEIEIRGKRIVHPLAKKYLPILKKINLDIIKNLKYKGVFIQDKELTLSIHYRMVSKRDQKRVLNCLNALLVPWNKKFKISHGKKIVEIRPPLNWNKGAAVKWVIKKLNLFRDYPIYLGDDTTDEDAFRALKRKGETILVGKNKKSAAKKRIKNIAGVYRYLKGLM